MTRQLIVQRLLGTLFLLAGIGKFSTRIENPYQILEQAQAANLQSWTSTLSTQAVDSAAWLIPLIGICMIMTGVFQLINRGPLRLCAAVQLGMIAAFVTLLWRAFPAIIVIDGLFVATLLYLLNTYANTKVVSH